jgi:hypothetical protein
MKVGSLNLPRFLAIVAYSCIIKNLPGSTVWWLSDMPSAKAS